MNEMNEFNENMEKLAEILKIINSNHSIVHDLLKFEGFTEIDPRGMDNYFMKLFETDIMSNSLYAATLIKRVAELVELGIPGHTLLRKVISASMLSRNVFDKMHQEGV